MSNNNTTTNNQYESYHPCPEELDPCAHLTDEELHLLGQPHDYILTAEWSKGKTYIKELRFVIPEDVIDVFGALPDGWVSWVAGRLFYGSSALSFAKKKRLEKRMFDHQAEGTFGGIVGSIFLFETLKEQERAFANTDTLGDGDWLNSDVQILTSVTMSFGPSVEEDLQEKEVA